MNRTLFLGAFGFPQPVSGRNRGRRGFSLLEVMISIFVILFAMMSLAALLPVGQLELARATNSDRSVHCGMASIVELSLPRYYNNANDPRTATSRPYFDPQTWRDAVGFTSGGANDPVRNIVINTVNYKGIDAREAFAIDPLYCAKNQGNASIQRFPYNYNSYNDPVMNGPQPLAMRRVTLYPAGNLGVSYPSLPAAVHESYFDRLFTWQDDLAFGRPINQNARPELLGLDGRYSWMATVAPVAAAEDIPAASGSNPPYYLADKKRRFRCSVAVFNRRGFEAPRSTLSADGAPPEERVVTAVFDGGGDLTLKAPLGMDTYLNVRENEWLMLCGREAVLSIQGAPYFRNVFRWYRVVAVSAIDLDPNDSRPRRMVTLAGEDFNPGWCFAVEPSIVGAQAALFSGIIGVYSRELEL